MKSERRKLYETLSKTQLAKRKFVTKYSSLSGVIMSKKNQTNVWFESALEKDFTLMLEFNPKISSFSEQPVTIEYYNEDKKRKYTPDFLVKFANSHDKPWLCEIKYKDDLYVNFSKYKPKFKAAIQFCKEQDWEFKIFTEDMIRTDLLENLKFLNTYEKEYVDPNCYSLVVKRVEDLGLTTINEVLITLSDANPSIYSKCIYALWYALKTASLGCDYSKPLSKDTEIWKQ